MFLVDILNDGNSNMSHFLKSMSNPLLKKYLIRFKELEMLRETLKEYLKNMV